MVSVPITTAKEVSSEFKELVQAHQSIKNSVGAYGTWTWRWPWPFGMTNDPLVAQVEKFQVKAQKLFENVQTPFQEKQLTNLFAEELKTKLKAVYWEPASDDILGKIAKCFRGIIGFLVGENTKDISQKIQVPNVTQLSLFHFDTISYSSNGDGTSGSFHLTQDGVDRKISVHSLNGAFAYEVLGKTTDSIQKACGIAFESSHTPPDALDAEKWTLTNVKNGQKVTLSEKFMTASKMLTALSQNECQETYAKDLLYGAGLLECLPDCIQIIETQKIDQNISLEKLNDCLYAFDYLNNDLGKQLVTDAIAKHIVSHFGEEPLPSHELKQLSGYISQVNSDLGVNLVASCITAMLYADRSVGYLRILEIVKHLYSHEECRLYEDKLKTLINLKSHGHGWYRYSVQGEMKNDRDVVIAAVRKDRDNIHNVSKDLLDDNEFMFEVLKRMQGERDSICGTWFRAKNEVCYHSHWENGCACTQLNALEDNKEFMLKAIDVSAYFVYDASERLRNDREVGMKVAQKHPGCFASMGEALRNNDAAMLDAIEVNSFVTAYASEELRGSREFIRRAIERSKGGVFALFYASDALKKDKELVLRSAELNGYSFQCADIELRKSKEFVFKAIEKSGGSLWTLHWAEDGLKKDREFLLKVVALNGWYLQFASDDLKNDREIVLAAVGENGEVLQFASPELQKDEEVIRKAEQKRKKP